MRYKNNHITVSEGFVSGTKMYLLIFLVIIVGIVIQLAFIGPTSSNQKGLNTQREDNISVIATDLIPVGTATTLNNSKTDKIASIQTREKSSSKPSNTKPSNQPPEQDVPPKQDVDPLQGSKNTPRIQGGAKPIKSASKPKQKSNSTSKKPSLSKAVKPLTSTANSVLDKIHKNR